jgi:hypothetical protein
MATKHDNRHSPERRDEENRLGPATSGMRKSPISIDEAGIAELISFFRLLRKWDQEARSHEKMQ